MVRSKCGEKAKGLLGTRRHSHVCRGILQQLAGEIKRDYGQRPAQQRSI